MKKNRLHPLPRIRSIYESFVIESTLSAVTVIDMP
jgi:hypothetical protein